MVTIGVSLGSGKFKMLLIGLSRALIAGSLSLSLLKAGVWLFSRLYVNVYETMNTIIGWLIVEPHT